MTNPHSTPDAEAAARHKVLRCTVGSKALGLNLPGTDDTDHPNEEAVEAWLLAAYAEAWGW